MAKQIKPINKLKTKNKKFEKEVEKIVKEFFKINSEASQIGIIITTVSRLNKDEQKQNIRGRMWTREYFERKKL